MLLSQVAVLGMPRAPGATLSGTEMYRRMAAGFGYGSLCFHTIAVVMGAPLLSRLEHTLAWALLMASCTAVPACCRWGYREGLLSEHTGWNRCFVFLRPLSCLEDVVVALPSYGAFVGAWIGGCAGPLDWEVPWQVWPVASAYGTCGGAAAGSLLAGLGTLLHEFQ